MNLQKNCIAYTAFLACEIFHRMVVSEAQVHVGVHALYSVGVLAPLVAAGRDDLDVLVLEFRHGIEATMFPDGGKVTAVGKMVEKRNAFQGINAGHGAPRS